MRFLKGDVISSVAGMLTCVKTHDWTPGDGGWRLVRTAREEWGRKHLKDGGEHRLMFACYTGRGCPECGEYPSDPRPADEIAALKAGKAERPPQMDRETWDRNHTLVTDDGGGMAAHGARCEVGRYAGLMTFFSTGAPECKHCGPRPAAAPVMTCEEWDEHHQLLWRREPEGWSWRMCSGRYAGCDNEEAIGCTCGPRPAVEPEHVHLRELHGKADSDALRDRRRPELGAGRCKKCRALLPDPLPGLIAVGKHDCPSCGWHSGRCNHCRELLVSTYKPGSRDHGQRHCPRCEGVDE